MIDDLHQREGFYLLPLFLPLAMCLSSIFLKQTLSAKVQGYGQIIFWGAVLAQHNTQVQAKELERDE